MVKKNKILVKHIIKEGSRFHVISYDTNGAHCNIKNCEINKKLYESGNK